MPAIKKKTITKKSQSNQKRSKFTLFKSRRGMAMFLSVFAIGGAAYLISVSAAPYLQSIDSKQIIAGTYEQEPLKLVKEKNGKVTYKSAGTSHYVLNDGSLICSNGDKNGYLKVGVLSKQELSTLKKDVKLIRNNKSIQTPATVSEVPLISDVEGVIVSDKSGTKTVDFKIESDKPQSIRDFESQIKQLCEDKANTTVEIDEAVQPVMPGTEQAINTTSQNLVGKISSIFAGTAYAAPSSAGVVNTVYAQRLHDLTNLHRSNFKLPIMNDSSCLDIIAWRQAKLMVEANRHYHTEDLRTALNIQCTPGGWLSAGENVGRDSKLGADRLFLAYAASPAHDGNLRSKTYRCQGSAAYTNPKGETFHAAVFALMSGGCR